MVGCQGVCGRLLYTAYCVVVHLTLADVVLSVHPGGVAVIFQLRKRREESTV